MIYFTKILLCLILTIIIEFIPIVVLLKVSNKYFVAVNTLTNVLANIIIILFDIRNINYYSKWFSREFVVLIIEIIIILSEFYLYFIYFSKKKILKVLFFTIIANILSYNLGALLINLIK